MEHQPAWFPLHCLDHQNDFRDAMCKCSIRYFHIPIIHLVYPSSHPPPPPSRQKKIVSISIVSSFSWDLQSSQENLKTIFIRHWHISHNAHYLPPKISHSLFFFHFSWILQPSQEKLKTMLMEDFGVRIRCIMGDVQVANATFGGGDKQGVLWLM